jgi:hypothetical protein
VIERPVAVAFLAVPFVYVAAAVFSGLTTGAIGVGAMLGATLVVAGLSASGVRLRAVGVWLALALVGITVLALADPNDFGTTGGELAAGLFLGVPLVGVAWVGREREPLGHRLVEYGVALTWGLALLAARGSAAGSTGSFSGSAFATAFYAVNADQVTGLGGLATGVGYTTLPLHSLFDPVYAALAGVSVLGLLLLTVRPQTGLEVPLPVASRPSRDVPGDRDLKRMYAFSEAQRTAFRERSESEPPPTTWPPGLFSVVAGAGATGAFLLAAYVVPLWALFVVTTAIVGAGVVLVLVADFPGSVSRASLRIPRWGSRGKPPSTVPKPWARTGAASEGGSDHRPPATP